MMGALDNLLGGGFGIGLNDKPPDPNQTEYNPLINANKTLLQVGLSGIVNTGQLAAREGLIPGVHFGYYNNFFKRGGAPRDTGMSDPSKNRLVHLSDHIGHSSEETEGGGLLGKFAGNQINDLAAKVNKGLMWLGGGGEELFSYLGGPDSIYGIGTTIHRRWDNTTKDKRADTDDGYINWPSPGTVSKNQGKDARDKKILEKSKNYEGATGIGIQNYLKAIGRKGFWYDKTVNDSTTRTYHRESRMGLGNPGRRNNTFGDGTTDGQLDYSISTPSRVDKINVMDIIKSKTLFTDQSIADMPEDSVKFAIECVDSENAFLSDIIMFRAFLDDFSDSYAAKHNTYNYNGRGENFYTYDSFNRDISLGFKIAAQSRTEMKPLYKKLNYLVSNTAPDYNSTSGRIMTPFIKLSVGHYLNRVPGVLSSVSISWKKDYPWEIALDSGSTGRDKDMLVLPHVLDVSLKFKPVHNFIPKKSIHDSPFILPDKNGINASSLLNDDQKWLNEFESFPVAATGEEVEVEFKKGEFVEVSNITSDNEIGEMGEISDFNSSNMVTDGPIG